MELKCGYPYAPTRTVEDVMKAWWNGVILGFVTGSFFGGVVGAIWLMVVS